jgi:IS5 family transposase
MVGLLLLKQLENLSDERVVLQFKRNPYYQYFCGYSNYMPGMPCNATELSKSWLICLWLLLVLLL